MVSPSCVSSDDPAHRKKSLWQLLTIPPSSDIHNSPALDPKDESEPSPFEVSRPHGTCLYEHKDRKISVRLTDPLLFLEATRVKTAALGHEDVGKKATQKDYSQIAPGCLVGPKSVILGSMIGSGCTVGTSCRIINSVLLSGATVKDNCILQGCVLGENVTVESQCNLKNCAVASSQRVPDGTHLEAEQLGFTDPELERPVGAMQAGYENISLIMALGIERIKHGLDGPNTHVPIDDAVRTLVNLLIRPTRREESSLESDHREKIVVSFAT
ncbi:bacterial transferase hexapeptide repeat protein [Opisthorchis viverrini]|uniref:Bacterial transferase hexapeptide repeat protein n=1 Tax=Opisthorchis viverrini TaxID=6198 RepID=A0A1S8WXQ7_OPIVI|nr:bacterial transferase hexapeptide repeat protein [Opisthorchis viverrini]